MNIFKFFMQKNKANLFYRAYTLKYWKELPRPFAVWISGKHLHKDAISNSLQLDTYDGSGQSTHPDILAWEGELFLVCTPYPFACAKYENPCLYHGKTIDSMIPCPEATPLGRATGSLTTDYCSDPTLIVFKNKLYCFWRDTWMNPDQTITEQLLFRSSGDGCQWSKPITAYKNCYYDGTLLQLSPALLNYKDIYLYRIYVRKTRKWGGDLEFTRSTDGQNWIQPISMCVIGSPDGYDLWHIGIVSATNSKSINSIDEKLRGLFLYRNTSNADQYALFYAEGSLKDQRWQVNQQIGAEEMAQEKFFPYKSAFLPSGDEIICGVVDKHNRWYLWRKKIELHQL